MSSFPLLNLPNLPLEKTLLSLKPTDTIEFSLCSKKCKQIVKSIRYPYTSISIWISDCKNIKLRIGEYRCFYWNFRLKPLPRGSVADRNELRTIGGIEMRMKKDNNRTINSTAKPESNVKVIYDFLQELFNYLPIYDFGFLTDRSRTLLPHCFDIRKSGEMLISSTKPIPEEHIRYVIENVEVSKRLSLTIKVNPTFRCDSVRFKMDDLTIRHAQWITRDTFLSMDCARATLFWLNLPAKDLQNFIEQWINSDNTRLQWLNIYRNRPVEQLDLSKFQTRPWDPNARGRYFGLNEWNWIGNKRLDCSEGIDVIRNDGLLATIIDQSTNFCFVVWHNRFPSSTYPVRNMTT